MDMNIMNYTPSISNGNSIESYNPERSKTETKNGEKASGSGNNTSINDAAIISLSPEAIQKNQTPGSSIEPETGFSKTHKSQNDQKLNSDEKQIIQKLQLTDLHVKMHEQQHLAAAGSYAKGGASFHYTNGPDGKLYAVGGEVALDTSPIANNPQATITKAQVLRRAALAPSDPSGADRAIAAAATQMEAQARSQMANEKIKQSSPHPESRPGNHSQYQMKAYRHSFQFHHIGTHFNKIA